MKKITVIGLGYIGLPTAAVLAKAGMEVLGYDLNKRVVEALNKGEIIIEEPGLGELVEQVVKNGNLKGISTLESSDVFIVSVPTPINAEKSADMSYVQKAVTGILKVLKRGDIIILESTSPPGATEEYVAKAVNDFGLIAGEDVLIAHSPERVLPGKIMTELIENDRIIGGINEKSSLAVKAVYESFVKGNIYLTDSRTAEMCKLMENTFRDVNIALANELAILSENLGINAWEVIRLANKHPRVNIHQPGPGVGGHCIAVDPWFVIEGQPEGKLIRTARDRNDGMPQRVFESVYKYLKGIDNPKVAIFGVTYKPDVDDIRESPILKLIQLLIDSNNVRVSIHDPHVDGETFNFGEYRKESVYEAAEGADLLVLAVNHTEYKSLDFNEIGKVMRTKQVFDTRNFLDRVLLNNMGFRVFLLGRG
ncbi:MAG: nucleotide sugar dehydrogenase [Gudongella sp.]|nr:nucleotide sugar dehydrogenase [Gudongella sp.]